MSAGKCARCDKTVYPVEGLRCLDKIWHKGCFKCDECNMTLNMKNYKGFEKRPYCNAHCPQAKATTVADTPEIRRLAENTRIQSQAKYHEDFEKSKGKGFTTVLDDPEMRRIKESSKIISNVAYHGELERKKQMEEKRGLSGHDESVAINNNNNVKHQNKMQSNNNPKTHAIEHMTPTHQAQQYQQQQRLLQQQHQQQQQQQQHQQQHQLQQQQQYMQKQQMLLKQQQQQQYNSQNRQSAEAHHHHQVNANQRSVQQQHQHQINNHPHQQQMIMRQQQQQQQQIIMQQHRQSMDPSIPMSRQTSKQAIVTNNHPLAKHPNMIQAQNQPPIKYVPINDPITGQHIPPHLMGMQQHMLNPSMGQVQQQGNRRVMANPQQQLGVAQQHHNMHNYGQSPIHSMDGIVPKQSVNSMINMPLPHQIVPHPDQVQQLQMRPASFAGQPIHQPLPSQVPRRVFRAMYDYVANDVDEVSFVENDILVDCVNVDRNWLIGKVARSGQTGMLPANYVAELPSQ